MLETGVNVKPDFQLPPFMTEGLLDEAIHYAKQNAVDQIIGPADRPYMHRWKMSISVDGGCYLHNILRDDDDRALHDHPWSSLSVLLKGRLVEVYAPLGTDKRDSHTFARRKLNPGDVVKRSADFAHRLELDGPNSAWTLFMVGPRVREWGFWCPGGFRHWREYVDAKDPSKIGRGCD